MIIGITGGTGCGKTTALTAVSLLGGKVIDCDKVYHALLQKDLALLSAIDARFPGTVKDGALNRSALAEIVFSDENALLDLNKITHSAVRQEVFSLLEETPKLAAIDAIELFDGELAQLCDVTVAVTAPQEIRVQRLMKRDGITQQQALMRIQAQKPEAYFTKKCDYVLENTGTEEDFQKKCLVFFRNLLIIKETS